LEIENVPNQKIDLEREGFIAALSTSSHSSPLFFCVCCSFASTDAILLVHAVFVCYLLLVSPGARLKTMGLRLVISSML
jgi:hypothetical protein